MLFITLRAQQDFFYCVQLIAYNADRAAKAPNPTVYAELTKTLNDTLSQWAPHALKVCTDADKLNIPDTVVFAAKRDEATEMYTKFIADVAEDENWVVSLLAQVPGIQVCW
jgi:thiaminase